MSTPSGMNESENVTPEERRGFDRLVNFTDAVVAIALTLQLLPIIDIAPPQAGSSVWNVIDQNWGELGAFALSFIIVIVMWFLHNKVFNIMVKSDLIIVLLNTAWLLAIAILPWPTAMYGEVTHDETSGTGAVGLLYWSNLALISALGGAMAWHARRTPALLAPGALDRSSLSFSRFTTIRLVVYPAYLVLIGVLTELVSNHAAWLTLGLLPLGWLTGEYRRPSRSAASKESQGR